jgi:predicted nuclease of predicted toxin-antitoxin system
MRILLDESLPRKLGEELYGHQVRTVQSLGWAGLKNGELLRRAGEQFDVLITGDQNLEFQQNPARVRIPVIVLIAANNRIETLRPLVPRLMEALAAVRPDQFMRVGS